MATDLATRRPPSKSEAYLQGKIADLCARIRRVDLLAHLLALSLAILGYALLIGLLDFFLGNSTPAALRYGTYAAFLLAFGFLLARTVRCGMRRVNPYFVAHQLEQTLPDAKSSLINWLDLHDQAMPSAFQKTLSARATEQWNESDAEQTVKKRKNWILLGCHAPPTLGLLVLLILGPSAFVSSMLRAFAPFYSPPQIQRTVITLLQPADGDAEVSPTQSITFTAKIEGRIPAGNRADAPKLSYRYQASEDYLTKPLQADGAGVWTAQLHPAQIRTGFSYKLSAGDAETPDHQVRVRAAAHVKTFEITYLNPKHIVTFPNNEQTSPAIVGVRGSTVELVLRASRPVEKLRVEIATGNRKQDAEVRRLADDTFACRWTLEQPGQFRVTFSTKDGEENTDRDWYPIDVSTDEPSAPNNVSPQSAQEQLKAAEKEKNAFADKIKKALDGARNESPGNAKSSERNNSSAKGEPQSSPGGPQPQQKSSPKTPDNAGGKKDQGDGSPGESKDGQQKSKDSASKGDRKDGPKSPGDGGAKDGGPMKMQEPAGDAKGAGPMGANKPMPQQAKDQGPDDGGPMPMAKQDKADPNAKSEPAPGNAKGPEQNRPDVPNKDSAAAANPTGPPNGKSKGGMMNDATGEAKQGSTDSAKKAGSARGEDSKGNSNDPPYEAIASKIDPLAKGGDGAEKAAAALAEIAQNSSDPRKRDIAKQILKANGRDPNTGKVEKKKGPTLGTGGPFAGLSDEVKTAAVNREFAARIGQMQFDDWKKRMTPDLLKKAGLSETDWQHYLETTQSYDALVRQRNEKLLRAALQKVLRGNTAGSARDLQNTGTRNDPLTGRVAPPADLRDPLERFSKKSSP